MARKRRKPKQKGPTRKPADEKKKLPTIEERMGHLVNTWMLQSVGADMHRWKRPGGLDFGTLREVARRCEPIAAVIQTRQNQVAAFSRKVDDDKTPGWKVTLKNPEKEPTARDKIRIKVVEKFLEDMHLPVFREVADRLKRGRDYPEVSFDGLLRSWVRDRLTLDAIAGEKVRTQKGRLFTVWPMDAATIFHTYQYERTQQRAGDMQGRDVDQELYALTWMRDRPTFDPAEVAYVQLFEGRKAAGWASEDFVYGYANPRSDINAHGYGYSEIEMLIGISTAVLNAIAYNKSLFTRGSVPPGMLVLTGAWDETMTEGFKRSFENQMLGADGQNRLPILADPSSEGGKGAQWISMRGNNREMEYNGWLEFLMRIVCAVYQIDPEEIAVKGIGMGQPSMFDKGPAAALAHSKDKGLKPLLRFLEDIINRDIVHDLYDDLIFRFANVDPEDEAVRVKLATDRMAGGLTRMNEERAKIDLEAVKEDWAEAPTNPVQFQAWQQEKMAAQQEAMQGEQFPPESPEDEAAGADRFMFEQDEQEGPPQGIRPDEEAEPPAPPQMQKSLPRPASVGVRADVVAASKHFDEWGQNG